MSSYVDVPRQIPKETPRTCVTIDFRVNLTKLMCFECSQYRTNNRFWNAVRPGRRECGAFGGLVRGALLLVIGVHLEDA